MNIILTITELFDLIESAMDKAHNTTIENNFTNTKEMAADILWDRIKYQQFMERQMTRPYIPKEKEFAKDKK